MALICIGKEKDSLGRYVDISVDTDDLDDREYYYFRKAEKIRHIHSGADKVCRRILKRTLDADTIESNDEYNFLTDETNYLMLRLASENRGSNG